MADGNAAFLRPESAVGTSRCPGGSLNLDADLDDEVVQLSLAGAVPLNLGRAETAVGLSGALLAALVSESGTNGKCWEATFGGAGLRRNDATQVQGLND